MGSQWDIPEPWPVRIKERLAPRRRLMAEHHEIDRDAITHAHLVTMTRFMADHGYTPDQIAYAVEKPWKHTDVLREALDEAEFQMIALRLRDEGVGTDD